VRRAAGLERHGGRWGSGKVGRCAGGLAVIGAGGRSRGGEGRGKVCNAPGRTLGATKEDRVDRAAGMGRILWHRSPPVRPPWTRWPGV
jgi:hypothetical protein